METFIFKGNDVVIPAEGWALHSIEAISTGEVPQVGKWLEIDGERSLPDGWRTVPRRTLWEVMGERTFAVANRLYAEMDWRTNSRFCGRCGSPMEDMEDRGRRCPSCGNTSYPVISPAVIVAVEKEGKLLLGHNRAFPGKRYSVLAGFVDLGESLEDTVKREIKEEVGIKVCDVEYFGSQSWPFPRSLMVGFRAKWLEGEIEVDGVEIDHADWFAPENLPEIPGSVSISRRLIDDFIARWS
ncbi:NAD(+) diphosphatase [Dethiosulfovibrio salsuginis]|uniref:NAD(+) diphosphatase n=1 Tax=Dethiosulfovibrio salsuginis TaxID=561720 RepID=A0A1X7KFU9_9BACT|nr:NAD(+) diphosphatase [Dethiosulfovibrio salsuginis]SMG39358.1 NAD+ diphosphatase [Dethiosulfovibrio salsuginis]